MSYKSKRSRATDISKEAKRKVYERDGECCIFCGSRGAPNAHYIPRSHGGLGIEENIITACPDCHRRMDQSTLRPIYMARAKDYLSGIYPDWDEDRLVYKKEVQE